MILLNQDQSQDKCKVNVGVVLTMNAPKAYYGSAYEAVMERQMEVFKEHKCTV